MAKFVTTSGLARFYAKVSSLFALKNHNHEIDNINNLQTTLSKKIDLNISDVDPVKNCMWFNTKFTGADTPITNKLLDFVYPIGSVYININDVNPNILLGGSWERIAQGRTLFGEGNLNGNTYTAGDTVDAGLPNIEGKWTANWNEPLRGIHGLSTEGAFYDSYPDGFNGPGRFIADSSGANSGTKGYPWFDASRSNPIYGKSQTVQPNALVVYIWKRTF